MILNGMDLLAEAKHFPKTYGAREIKQKKKTTTPPKNIKKNKTKTTCNLVTERSKLKSSFSSTESQFVLIKL